ncbi:MAG TPA: peptide chain release factor N(5)-glutamine methyltransferase [Gemmatimonadales bacterium]|nr:peptide chain release factor N(5)-glutamine methyltransferase [Gemmatimonadales bacterium]
MPDRNDAGRETLRRSSSNRGGQETAAAVWAAVSGLTVGEAWLRRDEPKAPELVEKYQHALEQIARGVPFAYAVGRAAFRALDLAIDSRALIPRPETEGLVELALNWCRAARYPVPGTRGVAADIGTGCGCIALALATEGNFDRVIAVERSPEAAALARENVALVAPRTPVEVREGNLLEPLAGARCRIIVSNPPYLTEAEYEGLAPSVGRYEPREALVSGPDGLVATRALLAGAAALLEPGGVLVLEIDERRGGAVRALAHQCRWARIEIHNDLFGRPRYALAFPREAE